MFNCDDCGHSFFVPGTNQPLVIEGGCPECGGHARPERGQSAPIHSEGDLRNMVDPSTGDDTGGNPLQEGILGETDGGWKPGRSRDESYASVQAGYNDDFTPSLVPGRSGFDQCPRCQHLIGAHARLLGQGCDRCGFAINRDWPIGQGQPDEVYPQINEPPKHPVTGEPVTSPLHVPVADDALMKMVPRQGSDDSRDPHEWQPGDIIESARGGRAQVTGPIGDSGYMPLRHVAPGAAYHGQDFSLHPMSLRNTYMYKRVGNEPVQDYVPKDWSRDPLEELYSQPSGMGWDDPRNASSHGAPSKEWVNPMRLHPQASNQTPALPWQFDVEEVAEPGMDNDDAEAKINGQEKKAGFGQALLEQGGGMAGGSLGQDAGAALGTAVMPGVGTAIGAIGGRLLGGALGRLMGGALGGGGGGGGNGPSQPNQTADGTATDRPMEMISSDGFSGGGTPGDFPKDTDAEKVDPHEHNDGDHKDWQNDVSVNGMGGTDTPHGFDPDGAGMERANWLLPLIMHYFNSDESGADDPLIKALHECLEQENPGYLDHPGSNDPKAVEQVIIHLKGGKPDDSTDLPKNDNTDGLKDEPDESPAHQDHKQGAAPPPGGIDYMQHSPEEAALNTAPGQGHDGEGNCPHCGAYTQFLLGGCPHCGQAVDPLQHQAASHQGPHSPEQIAAVQQLLIQQGRTDEVPNVPMAPWDYADELAQVANQPDSPPQDIAAQPQPAQEEAPPGDTMPMPGMTAPPPGQFGTPTSSRQASPEGDPRNSHDHTHSDGVQGAPAADQLGQEDVSQEQDSSGQWQTEDGLPLRVGEQYELHTPGVDIPDVVQVHAVRPDSVSLEFKGAYEMGFTKDITRQEFGEMGYSLTSVRGDAALDSSADANSAPDPTHIPDFSGPGSAAGDLSTPHQVMTKWHVKSFMPGAPGGTQPGGQCQQCGGPLQPNGSCAGCERGPQAAGAPGVPPAPGGLQNPMGGPPAPPAQAMNPGGSNPSRPPVSRTPTAYSSVPSRDPETGELLDADAQRLIARLLANAAAEDAAEGTRTAGAHYSPNEQRELIDEDGAARNADKLDLTNTHYQSRRETTADDFVFGW